MFLLYIYLSKQETIRYINFFERSAHLPNEIAFTVDRYKRMRRKKEPVCWSW